MGSKKIRKLLTIWMSYTLVNKTLNAYGLVDFNMMHFSDVSECFYMCNLLSISLVFSFIFQMMQLVYKLFTFLKSR